MAGFILRSVGSFRSEDFIEALPEKIIFDKADEAGNAEMRGKELAKLKEQRDNL